MKSHFKHLIILDIVNSSYPQARDIVFENQIWVGQESICSFLKCGWFYFRVKRFTTL